MMLPVRGFDPELSLASVQWRLCARHRLQRAQDKVGTPEVRLAICCPHNVGTLRTDGDEFS